MQDIQLLGQRCSGTNYLQKLIERNIKEVQIVKTLAHKHLWYGDFDFNQDINETIIIVIVRNPFNWIRSVHREPHHCPDLLGQDMTKFLRSPWVSWVGPEWNSPNSQKRNSIKKPENLREVCDNVLDVRNKKINTLLKILNTYPNSTLIRLEDLQEDPLRVLSTIIRQNNLTSIAELQDIVEFKDTKKKFRKKSLLKINTTNFNHIVDSLDWENENRLGYTISDYTYDNIIPWFKYKFHIKQALSLLGIY